jgi:hypothetical protein
VVDDGFLGTAKAGKSEDSAEDSQRGVQRKADRERLILEEGLQHYGLLGWRRLGTAGVLGRVTSLPPIG